MTIIALSGHARSGKDTVGQILVDDYGFRRLSFAQAIKNVAAEMNPVLRTKAPSGEPWFRNLAALFAGEQDWEAVKDQHPAAREFLQKLGVAVRDQVGPDVWLDAVARQIDADPGGRYVITDCRFPNEVAFTKARGGEVWRVVRPNNTPVNSHQCETGLPETGDLYDRIIQNNGTLADLRRTVLESGGAADAQTS